MRDSGLGRVLTCCFAERATRRLGRTRDSSVSGSTRRLHAALERAALHRRGSGHWRTVGLLLSTGRNGRAVQRGSGTTAFHFAGAHGACLRECRISTDQYKTSTNTIVQSQLTDHRTETWRIHRTTSESRIMGAAAQGQGHPAAAQFRHASLRSGPETRIRTHAEPADNVVRREDAWPL
jgi:hypothetical protein